MPDAHGPIDYVLLEFRGGHPLDEVAAALTALVDLGVIALYDLVAIRKADDGPRRSWTPPSTRPPPRAPGRPRSPARRPRG